MTAPLPHHDVKITTIPCSHNGHAAPGSKPVLQEHVGMELGQQCKEKGLPWGWLEWVVAIHVHTRGAHRQSLYEVVSVPDGVVGVGWQKELEVSCSVRLQVLIGCLPSYQTGQDLFRAPKVILLIKYTF